jgi:CheY-like chemotaxis protein
LRQILQQVVDLVAQQARVKGVDLEASLGDDNATVYADAHRMEQVFLNVLSNAIKFTPADGRISVRVEQDSGWAKVTISDTGRGMDREFLPRLFQPFSQAETTGSRYVEGMGLGLSITRELLELHGGTIAGASEGPDCGSTFIIRLPLLAAGHELPVDVASPDRQTDRQASLQGIRILLVEDDALTRESLARMFRQADADVAAAADAKTALDEFQRQPPDAIVSDIGLPETDGYQFMQMVRSWEREHGVRATPAVALTAFASRGDRQQAREAGYHEHLAKPVSPNALKAIILDLLNKKSPGENSG